MILKNIVARHDNKMKENYIKIIDGLQLDDTDKGILKSTWLDYLLLMNSSAKKGWFRHNFSQIAVIVLSLLIPVIEKSKLNINICKWDLTIISILGLIVAILTSLNRQLGFEERWRHYRMNAEAMRNEGDDFFALGSNYSEFDTHKKAYKAFISNITHFKRQEVKAYIVDKNKKKEGE